MIERLNCEIRRRTSVIGIFPNESSYVRLVTTYLMEYAEDWSVARAYISHESIAATLITVASLHFSGAFLRTLLDAVKKAETGNLLYGFEFDYAGNGSDRAWSIKSRNKDAPSVLSPYSQQTVLYATAKLFL